MNIDQYIQTLSKEDLEKIENDIKAGVLQQKIRGHYTKLAVQEQKVCAVCGMGTNEGFTLVFGPADFRKKATFCAMDCLEYFIQHLKGTKDNNEYY